MYYFPAAQETVTVKWSAFALRFETEERNLRVNKSKISGQNTFNGNHFGDEGNHRSSKNEKFLFLAFLQFCDQCFNP